MKKTEMRIAGKDCVWYEQENAEYLLVQPVDEHDRALLDSEVAYIADNTDKRFVLAAFHIDDWNRALTPWEMPLLRGKGCFGSGAADTLDWMCRRLLPYCTERLGMAPGSVRCFFGRLFVGRAVRLVERLSDGQISRRGRRIAFRVVRRLA